MGVVEGGRAYVVMTALPPTKGHLRLIEFASHVGRTAEVILCTQPGDPYAQERYDALVQAARRTGLSNVSVHRIHRELPQEPDEAVGFWDMCAGFLSDWGITKHDYVVASENYGAKLAQIVDAKFIPYDIDRSIEYTKATRIRENPRKYFSDILPEFQPYLRQTVTVFGAESVGKTTYSKELSRSLEGRWFPEWARPYLEVPEIGTEVTREKMYAIHTGQKALQEHAQSLEDRAWIVQDTDLFSTVGYWGLWEPEMLPTQLVRDARALKSDLYLILRSNIPFERDPLRYGEDKRESSDQYWINLCERYGLNYRVIDAAGPSGRLAEGMKHCQDLFESSVGLTYLRKGREYGA